MSDQPNHTAPIESTDRNVAVERALRFFLDEKGWRPSTLAKESDVSTGVVHQAVMGYAPSVATLQRLCIAFEVELWVFFLMGEMLSMKDLDPAVRQVLDTYRQSDSGLPDLEVRLRASRGGGESLHIQPSAMPRSRPL